MRRLVDDRRRTPGPRRFEPTGRTQAPAIAGDEAGEIPLRPRRDEVIPGGDGELEKVGRHHGAHRMHALVGRPGPAAAVAEKPGEWLPGAGQERAAEHVAVGLAGGVVRSRWDRDHAGYDARSFTPGQ